MTRATFLTELDRASLARMTREWRLTPPCFTPNATCRDQVARGLLETKLEGGRWYVRMTELAEQLLGCEGAA